MDLVTLTLLAFMSTCAQEFNVDPAFCKAVAHVESRTKTKEFRFGRLGKTDLYGPMGVKQCFLETGSPFEVIVRGVKALRPRKGEKTKWDILNRYNASMTRAYYREVCKAEKKYRRQDHEKSSP